MKMETIERPVVLLVDDDEELAKLVRDKFERHLFDFLWARTVEEGIQLVKETPGYIVSFVDIMFGEKKTSGFEFFRYIYENEAHRVVTFGFTGITKAVHLVEMKALELGVTTFFSKLEENVFDRLVIYADRSVVMRLVKKGGEDELTGFLNYLGFKRQVIPEMIVARDRPDNNHPEIFALLILELTSYKECRDQHGYMAGNKMLLTFTELLRSNVRPTDHICRNGEDEFMIWLPAADRHEASEIGAKIEELASHKPVVNGKGNVIPLHLSIGASQIRRTEVGRDADHRFEELVEWARRSRYP